MKRLVGIGNKIGMDLLLFFIALLAVPYSGGADLVLDAQKHVYGGKPQVHHGGYQDIPAAWSGSVHAIVYYDYLPKEEPGGMFLLLSSKNGNVINKPVRLTDHRLNYTDIQWDGAAFVIFLSDGVDVSMKKFSVTGNLLDEKKTSIPMEESEHFSVFFKNDGFHLFKFNETNVLWYKINKEGKVQDSVISLTNSEKSDKFFSKIFLSDSYIALLGASPADSTEMYANVSIFNYAGQLIGGPTKIPDILNFPTRTIRGNNENIVAFGAMRRAEGGVDMKSFRFDLKGQQIGEPAAVGAICPDGYSGNTNFTTELVTAGPNFLAVWDNGFTPEGNMEYIYVRLLDAAGQPAGPVIQINQAALDQTNHAGIYTGDGFSVFSIEQGYLQPSVDYTRLVLQELQPTSTPTPAVPNATSTATPDYKGAKLSLRAYIDGLEKIHIQGNQLWDEHLNFMYDLPGKNGNNDYPIYVNQKEWMPEWTDNFPDSQVSDSFTINLALPAKDGYYYQLISTKARGEIVISQQPNKDNSYELILLLNDWNNDQADWYEFGLGWSTEPPNEYKPPVTPYFYWRGLQRDVRETIFIVQEDFCTVKSTFWDTITYNSEFSEPLPRTSVNLTGVMVEGNGRVIITQQPRPENDYTAVFILMVNNYEMNKSYSFYVTWSKPLPAQPTATPVPTFNPAQPSPTPGNAKSKILCFVKPDDRNNYVAFNEAVKKLGLEVVSIPYGDIEITPALLQDYAAVVVGMFETLYSMPMPLTVSEQNAVLQYVRGGGGLLINGLTPNDAYINLPAQYCNSFGKPFGITFTEPITSAAGEFLPHPVTTDLRYTYCFYGSILNVAEPAKAIGFFGGGESALACAEDGYGRVIALSGYTMGVSGNSSDYGMNLPAFMNNILAWLLHKEETAITKPTPLPKNSMMLSLTNEGLFFPQDITFTIQGSTVTHAVNKSYQPNLETVINQALPSAPVILQVTSPDSIILIKKVVQPTEQNNYKASISIKVNNFMDNFNGPAVLIITWDDPLVATPAPTPPMTTITNFRYWEKGGGLF